MEEFLGEVSHSRQNSVTHEITNYEKVAIKSFVETCKAQIEEHIKSKPRKVAETYKAQIEEHIKTKPRSILKKPRDYKSDLPKKNVKTVMFR
jgi:hypothetical protein